jgi:hypothetical protein
MKAQYSTCHEITTHSQHLRRTVITIAALSLLNLMICSAAFADTLAPIITSPAGASMVEGGGPVELTFKVFNPNNFTLILDYAFCSITPGPPDTSDFAQFSGNNGSASLVAGALIIPGKTTGKYTYSFSSPDAADIGTDYGKNPVTFAIEMSPLGNHTPPPINIISSAIGSIAWVDLSGIGNLPQQPALSQILNLQNAQPNLLYKNGVDGKPPGMSFVKVSDVSEPSSLALLGSSILGLGGFLRKRILRRS